MPKYKILIGLDKPLFNLSPEEKELLESSKYENVFFNTGKIFSTVNAMHACYEYIKNVKPIKGEKGVKTFYPELVDKIFVTSISPFINNISKITAVLINENDPRLRKDREFISFSCKYFDEDEYADIKHVADIENFGQTEFIEVSSNNIFKKLVKILGI